jgi:O-succinylbenzoic acid--CoA ligase
VPSRPLVALDAPLAQDDVQGFRRRLDVALMGNGPALVPLDPSAPTDASLRAFLADVRPRVEGSVALVLPTSGSTGRPRLVKLSAAALLASAAATHAALGGPGRWLLALPTSHIAGVQVLVRSLLARQEPVVVDRRAGFTVEAFAAAVAVLTHDQPRYTALVPTQLDRVLASDAALLRAFDAVLIGGAAAPPALIAAARDAGVQIVVTYGMTETCGGVVYDGRPLPGTEVELDTWGRIRLRGPTLFSGYLGWPDRRHEQRVDADTWFTTADLGELGDDGQLRVLGRADDVIVTGGVNVAPAAVEAVLADHPAVSAVCVVGRADQRWGQVVTAVVASRPDQPPPTLESLREFARERLPAEALPRVVVSVPAIPMLASGKPDRLALAALLATPNA